jgi:hypothetical protein
LGVVCLEDRRAHKGEALAALVDRQALDDQLVADVLERLVVEPELLAQPPIADPLLQVQQTDDEGQGLRERCYGLPPAEPHAGKRNRRPLRLLRRVAPRNDETQVFVQFLVSEAKQSRYRSS